MRRTRIWIALSLAALTVALPLSGFAREYRCSVTDAVGDTSDSPGSGYQGEPYQDIVGSGIERTIGAITFSMEVAAAIPSEPRMKNPNGLVLWMWGMNTGSAFQLGYPLAPGNSAVLGLAPLPRTHLSFLGSMAATV